MKYLVVLCLVLITPTAAVAGPCTADKAKFCKEVQSGGDVNECLNQHMNELSEACKARQQESGGGGKDEEKEGSESKP